MVATSYSSGRTLSLLDLSAKIVAEHIPFQSIEQKYEHIPEPVQRRIIYWSFPRNEDDIRMYSSLSSEVASNTPLNNANTNGNSSNNTTQQYPSPNSVFPWIDNNDSNNNNNNTLNNNNHANNNGSMVQNSPPNQNTVLSPNNSNKGANHHSRLLTFHKGLRLYNEGCVHDVLQVGFNLSGVVSVKFTATTLSTTNSRIRSNNHSNNSNNNSNGNNNGSNSSNLHNNDVNSNQNQAPSIDGTTSSSSSNDFLSIKNYRVSVIFDRCKITSVSCSCELQDIFWCEHVVALIIFRIRNPETIDLRVPISETLSTLDKRQLQKLVQYLIAEHHTEVLPTAQRLLDEMRQSFSTINRIQGAPDPTAGASTDDKHIWHLDEKQVNEKVQNYLNLVSSNSKDAVRQINALFDKVREMFRAKDSNGTRLLKLITEQFLLYATRSEKYRPLWDHLVSLWVVVILNPDMPTFEKQSFMHSLSAWSKVPKCPKEDVERKVAVKRKAAELSDDEDGDELSFFCDYHHSLSQSNTYPAHMATHRHRTFQSTCGLPVLRPFNNFPALPQSCPYQLSHSVAKKMRSHHAHHNMDAYNPSDRNARPSNSLAHSNMLRGNAAPMAAVSSANLNENRPAAPQEPRSIFYRAIDFHDMSWEDAHLKLILNKDGPVDFGISSKSSNLFDSMGNPLWNESISQVAARVETLKSHGHRDKALRLTVATVRRLKVQQDQWCLAAASESNMEIPCQYKSYDDHLEGWIGHPFDPINVLMDILLDASISEMGNRANASEPPSLCSSRCSCTYNQALADFTHRLLPDLATLSYHHRLEGFPLLPPLVSLATRRVNNQASHSNSDKTHYYHVPVPSCCQRESYLTLAVEIALIALGQQRSIPTIGTAHDRAVRQESEIISKLESIDTSDSDLTDIIKHQATLLLEGGPFHYACCGVPTDSAPLHTFARYLFDSLVSRYPQLAYKVGVYALKMPLLLDENGENFGAPRASPRSVNHSHLQSEQLNLAQTMLSKAKDEGQPTNFMRKVYRASIKNIRNPASLLKLSKHVLKEAKPSGSTVYPTLLQTSFELGLQVLKITMSPQVSNGKTRREAIQFIVECATDIGIEAVLKVMKDSRDYFSASEALNLIVTRDSDHSNLRSQALTKLKLRENQSRELDSERLNRMFRESVLDCASRDPTNCALEALKFCEPDEESLKRALKIVLEAGTTGAMDSTQLIKVSDYIAERGMTDKAFDIALVAVDSLSIPSNSDNSSSKKDILSACDYAAKVNGFSTLIPKLIANIECATVLSDIYNRYCPNLPRFRNYCNDVLAGYRGNINYNNEFNDIINNLNNAEICWKQKMEDARWWDELLKRTLRAFVDTTRTRLQNISPRHYGEFIEFLAKAQGTFEKSSDGPQQFRDLIAEIMKSYRTKKKLMERLKARFDHSIKATMLWTPLLPHHSSNR